MSTSQPLIRVHVHEHAGTVILNRTAKRNALSRQLLADLLQAFGDLHQERRVRAVVLTGAGTAFSAGMDLEEMRATGDEPNPHARWRDDTLLYQEVLTTILRFPKPVIAAVNGPAMAGGAGLVLAADVVIASENATFGLPEPLRGLSAAVVSPLLTFRLGGGYAAYLLMTAKGIDAREAHRVGLVHEIIAADHLWPRAVELAAACARCAPESLQITKRMLNETIGEHLDTLLTAGAALSAAARSTESAAEGLAAYREKRQPKWP